MKKYVFITIILFLSYYHIYGQISTKEEPVSFKTNVSILAINEKTQKNLPLLDMDKIRKEDEEDKSKEIPPRFGYRHKVDYNLDNSGEWTIMSNGDRIWRLNISCPNALSINLLYDKFWLPEGAKFFIYSG